MVRILKHFVDPLEDLVEKGRCVRHGRSSCPGRVLRNIQKQYIIYATHYYTTWFVYLRRRKKNIPILTFQWGGDEFWNVYRGEWATGNRLLGKDGYECMTAPTKGVKISLVILPAHCYRWGKGKGRRIYVYGGVRCLLLLNTVYYPFKLMAKTNSHPLIAPSTHKYTRYYHTHTHPNTLTAYIEARVYWKASNTHTHTLPASKVTENKTKCIEEEEEKKGGQSKHPLKQTILHIIFVF